MRVCLHFHPDTDRRGGSPLAQLLGTGRYLSQFATGTSNGGLTAHAGGDRWRWEHRIFGGAYDTALPEERPVYGAMWFDNDPYGPAPRFGSAHLRLRPAVTDRTTFAHPDSVFEPEHFGVADRMGLLPLLAAHGHDDPLDAYVEAHVHGGVDLATDVEAIVLDPCFPELADLAMTAGLSVEFHPGYLLDTATLAQHSDYRGVEVVALGRLLAEDGRIDPAVLGRARPRDDLDPQRVKQLWHCLARFGRRDL